MVFVTSIHAWQTSARVGPYAAAKAALNSLARTASIEGQAKGLRVNAGGPGLIAAGVGHNELMRQADGGAGLVALCPMNRAGQAEEVAQAVAWLCSEQASFVNGHLLAVDGGYVSR